MKPQSLSFCHNTTVQKPRISEIQTSVNNKRSGSESNRYNETPPNRPPVDKKKTLAFKFKVQYSSIFRVYRAWISQARLQMRQKELKKLLLDGLVKAI